MAFGAAIGARHRQGAFSVLDFKPEVVDNIYRLVASVLHLGNLRFVPAQDDGSAIDPASGGGASSALQAAANALSLDPADLAHNLCFQVIKWGGGGGGGGGG